jgi:chemotaxis protein CheX
MPGKSTEERLNEILAVCLMELARDLGVKPSLLLGEPPKDTPGDIVAAFIGFGSDDVRGSFTLLGQPRVFARLHPVPALGNNRDLADWARELANQVVGRFKNRVLACGLSIAIGSPQSMIAEQVRMKKTQKDLRTPLIIRMEDMTLECWLELDVREGFALADKPGSPTEAALSEGTVVLF